MASIPPPKRSQAATRARNVYTRLILGDHAEAEELANEALEVSRRTGEVWFRAYVLNTLGELAAARGEFNEAEEMFRESSAIRHRFGDDEGVAVAAMRLGDLAMAQGREEDAGEHYEVARQAYEQISDFGGLNRALPQPSRSSAVPLG